MGGGGGGDSFDAEYNARMATLSEEQQGWAREYMNYYKHGVFYDPAEEIRGYYDAGGNFVQVGSSASSPGGGGEGGLSAEEIQNLKDNGYDDEMIERIQANKTGVTPEVTAGPNNEEIVTMTRGEMEGYDPDAVVSFSDVEMAQNAANMAVIPDQTDQAIAEAQTATKQAYSAGRLVTDEERFKRSEYEFGRAKNAADTRLVSDAEDAKRSEYDYTAADYDSKGRLIESGEGATKAGNEYSQAKAESDNRLISPYEDYTKKSYETESALLDPYKDATISEYGYAGELAEMNRSLLPSKQALNMALMDEAQRTVNARTPVTEKYYDKVMEGVDVNKKTNQAKADVAGAYKGAASKNVRDMGRYGINPNSARGKSAFDQTGANYARDQVGAISSARDGAEKENFSRLQGAVSLQPPPEGAANF